MLHSGEVYPGLDIPAEGSGRFRDRRIWRIPTGTCRSIGGRGARIAMPSLPPSAARATSWRSSNGKVFAFSVGDGATTRELAARHHLLTAAGITISLVGGHIFGAFRQNDSPGAYATPTTSRIAGLAGCFRALTVSDGAKAAGAAVNETLVLAFVALFALDVVLTSIGARFGTGH